jgi:hypothetical protein
MGPELKSNIILSGLSAIIITSVFYFWSRKDKEKPNMKTHVKVLISCFGVNFLLFYALHKKMVPGCLTGCPVMSGGAKAKSAPWNNNVSGGSVSVSGGGSGSDLSPQIVNPPSAKFTAVNLNEPTF